MVAEGKFREDLYYRLNVLPLTLPRSGNGREDVPVLMDTSWSSFQPPRRGRTGRVRSGKAGVHAVQLAGQCA